MREASAKTVCGYDLPGYAIGGVAVGEERTAVEKITAFTAPFLPENKPRYLMGIGTPWDIAYAVKCDADMFDCVSPTRLARHGVAFSKRRSIDNKIKSICRRHKSNRCKPQLLHSAKKS